MTYMIKPNFKELAKLVGPNFREVVKALKELNKDPKAVYDILTAEGKGFLDVCGYKLDSTMFSIVEDKLSEALNLAQEEVADLHIPPDESLEAQNNSDMYRKGWENGRLDGQTSVWYVLYMGVSHDGQGTPQFKGRTIWEEVAQAHLQEIERHPYAFGHVDVITDDTRKRLELKK